MPRSWVSGGGGSATVSYGSNATQVSDANAAGAASTVSRSDHRHLGVATITASSSNTLADPTFNLRPGTNVAFDVNAGTNTLTISAIGGAGGGGSVSYASNSNDVGSADAAGASTLVSRADHVHRGVYEVTASSSNTLSQRTVNLRAGTGIALGVDASTANQTITITNIGGVSGGGGGGAGSLVLLEQHTASSSATLDFTTFISATYDEYKVEIIELTPATNAVSLQVQFGTGGGPTWDTGNNYEWAALGLATDGSGGYNWLGATGGCNIFNDLSNNANYGNGSASLTLFDPQDTTKRKHMIGPMQFVTSGPKNVFANWGMTWTNSSTAATGLRFLMSSGNIASGTIRIYGVAKS